MTIKRKERLVLVLLLGCLGMIQNVRSSPTTGSAVTSSAQKTATKVMEPIPTESRRLALETAGAFENDGFRIRDVEWSGTLSKGVPVFLQVTLFAGEDYWFVAASPTSGADLRVTVYDAFGKPVKGELWHSAANAQGTRSAAGVAPTQSGKYFVGVEGTNKTDNPIAQPLDFSIVYCYK